MALRKQRSGVKRERESVCVCAVSRSSKRDIEHFPITYYQIGREEEKNFFFFSLTNCV